MPIKFYCKYYVKERRNSDFEQATWNFTKSIIRLLSLVVVCSLNQIIPLGNLCVLNSLIYIIPLCKKLEKRENLFSQKRV